MNPFHMQISRLQASSCDQDNSGQSEIVQPSLSLTNQKSNYLIKSPTCLPALLLCLFISQKALCFSSRAFTKRLERSRPKLKSTEQPPHDQPLQCFFFSVPVSFLSQLHSLRFPILQARVTVYTTPAEMIACV